MIEIKDITKSFEDRTVLHGVSATFETGKTNLIIGQSGSGKTVLMKSLVGLVRPEKSDKLAGIVGNRLSAGTAAGRDAYGRRGRLASR